jgi:hypothetical protein
VEDEYNKQKEKAEQIIDGIQERLVHLVEQRSFRFKDTDREDAMRYLHRFASWKRITVRSAKWEDT